MQSEIRQDKTTRQWVIYAPSRGKRPHDFAQQRQVEKHPPLPDHDPDCPFCPGNEAALSSIMMELPADADTWQTRVVPNKFPAVTPDDGTERYQQGPYLAMPGYGRHEVIIDSPQHNRDIATMSVEEVSTLVETYHRRYVELLNQHGNMMIIIFRNHGARAGTSLLHPHSQLIVTGVVPNDIRRREDEAQRYFDQWGRNVYQDILKFEQQDRRRVILENDAFLAFVPFAAEVPFEIWILPKRHQADFSEASRVERVELARALRAVLGCLHTKLHDPDYNFIIRTPARYKMGEPQLQWFLQIRPRLTTPAGFEIGSGISINPSLPEEDADFLNE